MKKTYSILFGVILILNIQAVVAQEDYKIIEAELKGKIEYDNAKKTDETKRVQIYFLYKIKVSGVIETREKIQFAMNEFLQKFKLEEEAFNYETLTWSVTSKTELTEDWIKYTFAKYDFRLESTNVQYGLKD